MRSADTHAVPTDPPLHAGIDPPVNPVHTMVGGNAGALANDPGVLASGDRFEVRVSCPADLQAHWDVVVFQAGEAFFPLQPEAALHCANGVTLPGAFGLTGSAAASVCVQIDATRAIDRDAARRAPGVVAVLAAGDLPPVDVSGPDQPLAKGRVFYVGQPVVAVVAETAAAAADAASLVVVDYDEIEPVTDPFAAQQAGSLQVMEEREDTSDEASIHGGGGNEAAPPERLPTVTGLTKMDRGDVAAALAASVPSAQATTSVPGAPRALSYTPVCPAQHRHTAGPTPSAPSALMPPCPAPLLCARRPRFVRASSASRWVALLRASFVEVVRTIAGSTKGKAG